MTPRDLLLAAGHLLALRHLATESAPDPRAAPRERAVLAAVLRGYGPAPSPALITDESRALALLAITVAVRAFGPKATADHAREALCRAPRGDCPLHVWRELRHEAAEELRLIAHATPRRSALPAFYRAVQLQHARHAIAPALQALTDGRASPALASQLRAAADLIDPPHLETETATEEAA